MEESNYLHAAQEHYRES